MKPRGRSTMRANLKEEADTTATVASLRLELARCQRDLEEASRRLEQTEARLRQMDTITEITERRKAEKKLQRSEAFLAEEQRISHTGNWFWNLSEGKLIWSEEQHRILEFSPDTTIPSFDLFLERVHPEDRSLVSESIHRAIRDRSNLTLEFRISLPNGSVKHIYSVSHPVAREDGNHHDFAGILMDITARKRAETLLAGEKRLLEMVARGDSLSAILSSICRLVEEVCVGFSCAILLSDSKAGELWPGAEPSLSACWSTPIFSKDNHILGNIALFARRSSSPTAQQQDVIGHITHLASIAIERKGADETLKRSEAYLAEGQRLSHIGSWAWIPASGEVFWSLETYRILDLDPETALPNLELAKRIRHPDDRALFAQTFDLAMRDGTDFEMDSRIVCPDGSVKHVHTIGHPVLNEAGKLTEFIGVLMDITERNKADEALRKAQTDLAHVTRLTAMGELTASIAHEVNQPLAAIVTHANACLRWLDRESPNLQEACGAIRRIIRDGNRGSDVIVRIRALLRKEVPSRTSLNVNEVVREIITLTRADLWDGTLKTELASQLPLVTGDRVQLQQVVLNLMLNAIDAMKSLTHRPRVLRIRTRKHEGGMVLVAVQDSGVGLDPEQMEKLFDAFYTTKPGGLGMGLSICRSIIEGHGGRLWAESNRGPGAKFLFTLPVENGGVE